MRCTFDYFGVLATGHNVYTIDEVKKLYTMDVVSSMINDDECTLNDYIESAFVKTDDGYYVDRQKQGTIQSIINDYNKQDEEYHQWLLNDPNSQEEQMIMEEI